MNSMSEKSNNTTPLLFSKFHSIALDMKEYLREKREEHNKIGTYSQDLHNLFMEQGFYLLLQPKKYGGLELMRWSSPPCEPYSL